MKPEQWGLSIGIATLLAAIFFVDTQMALGFTPWLLYVIPLGLTYWTAQPYAPFVVAALCTILIAIGYDLSPPLVPEHVALTNRVIGTVTFWMLASLIGASQLLARRLSHLTEQLRCELMERTQDLGRAVSALRVAGEPGAWAERDLPLATEEFKRQVTDVLAAESWRLQEKVVHLVREELPVQGGRRVWTPHGANWSGLASSWNSCSATYCVREASPASDRTGLTPFPKTP